MRAPLRLASMTPCFAQRVTGVLLALLFAAAALSCASSRPATRVEVIRAPIDDSRALPPTVIAPIPDTTAVPPVIINPATPPAEAPAAVESPDPSQSIEDELPQPVTSDVIALVLPLDVPAYERAAGAVRDGFLDAANAAGRSGACIVISHGTDGVVSAFETARAKGVRIVVGPLVRDDLKTLAISGVKLPWTLALNQLDDESTLPGAIFSFPLTVESDARVLAASALASGARSVDVIAGDSPLMKRFATSFALAWRKSGGRVPDALPFDAAPEALTGLRRTLNQHTPDAVLLAVSGERAALVKPFIGSIRAYASGLVFERPSPAVARDLDGVRVVEIPWLLTPDAPQFGGLPRRGFDSTALARLYALGVDAFRVAEAFENGPPAQFDLEGATGRITLVPGRQFAREGKLAVYRNGELLPEAFP